MSCHLLHDASAKLRVQHQLTAGPCRNDLGCRTAHIDIQKVELFPFDQGRSLAHDLRVIPKQLHAIGRIVGFCPQQRCGLAVLIDQSPARDHLADRKARAMLCHQTAAGCIRKTGHRAEHCPMGQGECTDL